MTSTSQDSKFRVKADLALFEAIQQDGKLSEEKIAQKTAISSTTIHYAMERIKRRDFFDIRAVPRLERFTEIPTAIIGFSNIHPMKIKELKKKHMTKPEIVQFMHSDKDIVLFVMAQSSEALTKMLFEIMEKVEEKPCIYITSPTIAKFGATIPSKVLEAVYTDLPDRRLKV